MIWWFVEILVFGDLKILNQDVDNRSDFVKEISILVLKNI